MTEFTALRQSTKSGPPTARLTRRSIGVIGAIGSAVLAAVLTVTGCSDIPSVPTPVSSSVPERGDGPSSGATTAPDAHATPEAAGEAFLHALGTGDGEAACASMAAAGRPIRSEPQASDLCKKTFGSVAQQVAMTNGPEFTAATVKNVQVSGDGGDFSTATIDPPAAKQLLVTLRFQKIQGGWYVTS